MSVAARNALLRLTVLAVTGIMALATLGVAYSEFVARGKGETPLSGSVAAFAVAATIANLAFRLASLVAPGGGTDDRARLTFAGEWVTMGALLFLSAALLRHAYWLWARNPKEIVDGYPGGPFGFYLLVFGAVGFLLGAAFALNGFFFLMVVLVDRRFPAGAAGRRPGPDRLEGAPALQEPVQAPEQNQGHEPPHEQVVG